MWSYLCRGFKDDKRHGEGKYTYSNGDIYEGEWKDNRRNGNGKLILGNGNIIEGEFKDNKEYNIKYYKFDYILVEGKKYKRC